MYRSNTNGSPGDRYDHHCSNNKMIFEVELTMFQKGAIRKVDVPDKELNGELEHDLEKIFYFGQNDFQPIADRVSVSAGDIVRYKGARYMFDILGTRKLNNGGQLSNDPKKRIAELFKKN